MPNAVGPVLRRHAWLLTAFLLLAIVSGIVLVRLIFPQSPDRELAAPLRSERVANDRLFLSRDPRPVKLIPRRLYSQPLPFGGR